MDCIFCKIIASEIPAEIVYEDAEFVAFKDIHPLAPVHVVLIPRAHIPSIADARQKDAELLGRMLLTSTKVAAIVKIAESGYRLVINYGADANLVVPHLHLHIIGGRKLSDKVG